MENEPDSSQRLFAIGLTITFSLLTVAFFVAVLCFPSRSDRIRRTLNSMDWIIKELERNLEVLIDITAEDPEWTSRVKYLRRLSKVVDEYPEWSREVEGYDDDEKTD